MAQISATDSFDEDELEPEMAEELSPLIEWLNVNFQNIVSALQGGLGDRNLTTQTFTVKASSGVRQSVDVIGSISNVQISRVESQPESNVVFSGLNWWPTANGFDFVAEFSGDKRDRNIFLRVDFDV